MEMITLGQLIDEARFLTQKDDINTEYNRGICELIAGVFPEEGKDQADRASGIADRLEIKIHKS